MSNFCPSTNWNDIIKVTAYEDSNVTFHSPFNVEKLLVTPVTDYEIIDSTLGIVLSISDMDASLKDDSKVAIPGHSHVVKLEYSMLCDSNDLPGYRDEIEKLEARGTNYHLVVEYLGGNKHFIRSTKDGYMFDWHVNDSGKTSCTITINNVSGPQKIIG